MGAWGIKALESDEGLDVVDFIKDYVSEKYSPGEVTLVLSDLVDTMKKEGFFGPSFDEIDFFFDHSAMALAELYLMFKHTGELDYENDEDDSKNLKKRVKQFVGDEDSIKFLLRYLTDIKNEVPDEDGERELVELWKESDSWDEWANNLNSLIDELTSELK